MRGEIYKIAGNLPSIRPVASENQIVALLSGLPGPEIDKLIAHMDEIQKILIKSVNKNGNIK
jgi:hypothetical protein